MPAPALPPQLDALRRHPQATSWAITSVALVVYFLVAPHRVFVYDANFYLQSSEAFSGWFSFTDYADPLRGYGYPWLLSIVADVISPLTDDPDNVARAVSLVLVPLLLCVIVPTIARRVSASATITVSRLLLLNALFVLAWHNDLLRTLSDIPALFFMGVGAVLVLRDHSAPTAIGAGLAFGLAFNFRPSYLLAVVVAVVLLFLVEPDRRSALVRTALVVVFVFVALAPQVAINLEHFDSFSPTPDQSTSLTRLQLTEGLSLDRYDTYVGDPADQPPAMRFENRALEDALVAEFGSGPGPTRVFDSTPDYVAFVLDHPAEVGAAYVRHLLNGLDVRFGGTYVESVDDANLFLPLVNYTVLALAVLSLTARFVRRTSVVWRGPTTWFTAVLVASCVPGIVGAVETRFLMPLHLTLLAATALCLTRADLPETPRLRAVAGAGVVAAVLAAFAFSAGTLSSLQPRPMYVDGRVVPAPEGG